MGTLSNRSFQRGNPDDDLLITLISGDEDAVRKDSGQSIRVYWESKLPMRLDFKDENWEVGLVEFSCRNREFSQPEVILEKGEDIQIFPLPKKIYDDQVEVVNEAFQWLSSQSVTLPPSPPADFSADELHFASHYYNGTSYYSKIQNQHFQVFSDERSNYLNSFEEFSRLLVYSDANPIATIRTTQFNLDRGNTATSDSNFMNWFEHYHHTNFAGIQINNSFEGSPANYLRKKYRNFDWTLFVTLQLAVHLRMEDQQTFDANYITNATAVLEYAVISGKQFVIINFMNQDSNITLAYNGGGRYTPPSRFQSTQGIPMDFSLSAAGDELQFAPLDESLSISLAYDPPNYEYIQPVDMTTISLAQVLDSFPSKAMPREVYPSSRLVKVKIYGLNLPQEWAMSGHTDESEALIFSIPLNRKDKTVSFVPAVNKEVYRPVQVKTCNSITVSVEFDDNLTPERLRPNFFVGNTSVTLKFRQTWKSGVDFKRF